MVSHLFQDLLTIVPESETFQAVFILFQFFIIRIVEDKEAKLSLFSIIIILCLPSLLESIIYCLHFTTRIFFN